MNLTRRALLASLVGMPLAAKAAGPVEQIDYLHEMLLDEADVASFCEPLDCIIDWVPPADIYEAERIVSHWIPATRQALDDFPRF